MATGDLVERDDGNGHAGMTFVRSLGDVERNVQEEAEPSGRRLNIAGR
jgi:hypothetical protein